MNQQNSKEQLDINKPAEEQEIVIKKRSLSNPAKPSKKTNITIAKKKSAKQYAKKIVSTAGNAKQFIKNNSDRMRTAGIVILTITMIGQSGMFWTKMLDTDSVPKGTAAYGIVRMLNNRTADRSDVIAPAAYPTKTAVRSEKGVYGIQYSTDGTKTAWEQTEDIWSTAFSSAKKLEKSTVSAYKKGIKNHMIFAEFDGSIPLELITGWIGAKANNADGVSCGGIMLCREQENSYRIFVRDSQTDTVYSAQTEIDDVNFYAAVNQFTANDCTIAADTKTAVFPDTLQFTKAQNFDTITIQPYTGAMTELLEAFEMDGRNAQETAYAGNDGTTAYVDDGAVVRVSSAGVMSYKSSEGIRAYTGNLSRTDILQKCAQLGYSISSDLLEAMGSGGQAQLTKAYTDKSGKYITVFSMHIDGVPVDNELGYFARYEFDDGVMTRADAVLRTCTVTGTVVPVMPERVVASSRQDKKAMLSLRYTDTADILPDSKWSEQDDIAADDLWNTQDSSESYTDESLWVDGTDYTADGYYDSTAGNASTLNSTGDTVSAEAKWKFVLYDEVEKTDDIQNIGVVQQLPSFDECHMPNFSADLSKGGAAP